MAAIDRIRLAAQRTGWTEKPSTTPDRAVFHRTTIDKLEVRQTVQVVLSNHRPTPQVRYAWLTTHSGYPTGTVRDERTTDVGRIVDMLTEEA